jgi:hypothetical protein
VGLGAWSDAVRANKSNEDERLQRRFAHMDTTEVHGYIASLEKGLPFFVPRLPIGLRTTWLKKHHIPESRRDGGAAAQR